LTLNVRQNRLTSLPRELFSGLAHCLVVLNASSNQLGAACEADDDEAGDPLAGLSALRRLEELRLNGNK
jgi:hypothetical protein